MLDFVYVTLKYRKHTTLKMPSGLSLALLQTKRFAAVNLSCPV